MKLINNFSQDGDYIPFQISDGCFELHIYRLCKSAGTSIEEMSPRLVAGLVPGVTKIISDKYGYIEITPKDIKKYFYRTIKHIKQSVMLTVK